MKIVWRTVKMLLLIGVMFIIQVKLADSQSLSICTNAKEGSPCRLTCATPDVTNSIFFLKLPLSGSQEGGCNSGGTCGATNVRYTVTQDSTLSETRMDISSLTHAEDDSQWVCDYGAVRSPAVQLTVTSIPTTVQFAPDPPTSDLSQTLVGEVYCVYPASSLTVKLVYQDGQTNNTLDMTYPVPTTNGTNGCGSHEFTVTPTYQLAPTTLSDISVRFWIEVTVAGQVIGSALTTETFVFQAATTTTTTTPATTTTTTPASSSSICDSCTTTYVLAALGIVFAVVCIVFCWMVYLQRSGKFQGPCSVFTKSKCSVKQTLIAAIIATSLCVIGIILCIVGLVTLIVALAVVGFVLPVFTHVIVIILLTFFCCGKIMEKDGDNKAVRARPDGQDAKPRTERTPRSAGRKRKKRGNRKQVSESPTSASNIKTKWRNNQVSDSNESDGSNDTPRRKLEAVPQGRKLPALELVDASQKANTLEPMEVNEIKKLKKKKKRRSKEEKAQVDGEY